MKKKDLKNLIEDYAYAAALGGVGMGEDHPQAKRMKVLKEGIFEAIDKQFQEEPSDTVP